MKIIPNSVGIFFPSEKNELIKLFNKYRKSQVNSSSRLIIVPHAGYEYSGRVAYNTYKFLDNNVDNVVVIAPAIYKQIYGLVSCSADSFFTPLGDISIKPGDFEYLNEIFSCEPAIGVQLPFVKYFFPNATITPILYGCEDYQNIFQIINDNINDSNIIIVSNLSRFVPERESLKLDGETSRKIAKLEFQDLDVELADGAIGICGAIKFAKEEQLKFKKTIQSNSSKINNDTSNVVGYCGWYLTR